MYGMIAGMAVGLAILKTTCQEGGVDFGTMEAFLGKIREAEEVYGSASALAALGPLHFKN